MLKMCIKFKKHVVGQLNQARNLEQLHRSINNICNGGLHRDGECTAFDCSVKSKTCSAKYTQKKTMYWTMIAHVLRV